MQLSANSLIEFELATADVSTLSSLENLILMNTPLIEQPRMKPFLGLLKREGWTFPLFALYFIHGMHGLPAAFHAIFSVRKSDIQSYEPIYSRHDLWVLHSGLLSIVSAFLILCVSIRWIRFYRTTMRDQRDESNNRTSEQTGDDDAEEAV